MSAREKADRAALTLRAQRVAALKAAEDRRGAGPAGSRPRARTRRGHDRQRASANARRREDSIARWQDRRGARHRGGSDSPRRDAARQRRSARSGRARGAAAPPIRPTADSRYGDLVGNKGGLTALHFAVREGNIDGGARAAQGRRRHQSGDGGRSFEPAAASRRSTASSISPSCCSTSGANVKLASDAGATPLYAMINMQWAAKSLYPQPTAQLKQQTNYLDLMEQMLKGRRSVTRA